MHTTNEKRACPCQSKPGSTNGMNPTTRQARGASQRRRFGQSVGEAIIVALALVAASRTFGGGER